MSAVRPESSWRSRGQQLAEFDKGRPELLESEPQILRLGMRLGSFTPDQSVRGPDHALDPKDVCQVGQLVADQNLRDLTLAVMARTRGPGLLRTDDGRP